MVRDAQLDVHRLGALKALVHGTRRAYRQGCHCTPCRSANALYMQAWRLRRAQGRPLLGARISTAEAHHLLRLIQRERYRNQELEQAFGVGPRNLARLRKAAMIELRTWLKIRRFYRQRVLDPTGGSLDDGHNEGAPHCVARHGLQNGSEASDN